jgi:hypothetical protein
MDGRGELIVPPIRPRAVTMRQPARLNPSSLPAMPEVAGCRAAASHARRLAPLTGAGFAVALLIGSSVHAEPLTTRAPQVDTAIDSFAGFVSEASQRFGIPASWIRAVMRVESIGDVHAVSPKGAMGLMQIMPETWAILRLRCALGANPFDPHDNILAGAAYIRELHDRYGSPGFLAAYNAGPARYEDHLATGRPLPAETRAYVAVLAPQIGGGGIDGGIVVAVAARSWTEAPLFVVHPESTSAKSQAQSNSPSTQLSPDSAGKDWTALAPQSDGLFVRTPRRNPQP